MSRTPLFSAQQQPCEFTQRQTANRSRGSVYAFNLF